MIDMFLKPIKFLLSFNFLKTNVGQSVPKANENLQVAAVRDEILSVEDMYTTISSAKSEIWERWNDEDLKMKVSKLLNGDLPEVFREKPKAVIFRNIATPNFEMSIAHEYACLLGLDLVVIEYTSDKFCTRNSDKLHFGKMMFFHENDKLQSVAKENVISIKDDDNKCFSDIKTLSGEDFVDFHHRIFKDSGYDDVEFFDASTYKKAGLSPYEIYIKILSICTGNAVLLENFLIKADKGEKKFTEQVIMPAFSEIVNQTGLRPIIVPLLGSEGEGSVCWQHYSEKTRKHLNLK